MTIVAITTLKAKTIPTGLDKKATFMNSLIFKINTDLIKYSGSVMLEANKAIMPTVAVSMQATISIPAKSHKNCLLTRGESLLNIMLTV